MENIKKYWYVYVVLFGFFLLYKPIFCFLFLGIMLMLLGLYCYSFIDYLNKDGIKTKGKIVSYESDNEGSKTPIIEFKTLEGKLITKVPFLYFSTDFSFSNTYLDKKNESIEVLYDKMKPQKFIIKTEKNYNSVILTLMIIIGLIFIAISIVELLELI